LVIHSVAPRRHVDNLGLAVELRLWPCPKKKSDHTHARKVSHLCQKKPSGGRNAIEEKNRNFGLPADGLHYGPRSGAQKILPSRRRHCFSITIDIISQHTNAFIHLKKYRNRCAISGNRRCSAPDSNTKKSTKKTGLPTKASASKHKIPAQPSSRYPEPLRKKEKNSLLIKTASPSRQEAHGEIELKAPAHANRNVSSTAGYTRRREGMRLPPLGPTQQNGAK